MKRNSLMFMVFITLMTFTVSCREAEKETVIKEVEVERVEEEEKEGILERTAKEVDNEVNEEIDQEIENIGDDN